MSRKWLFLLVKLCDLSGKQHSLKSPCIINSQKGCSVQKDRFHFSQATHIEKAVGITNNHFLSTVSVWKIYIKAVVSNPFVTADRSTFGNFPAVREYSRSASMGIDQSHTQKASSVTTSILHTFHNFAAGNRFVARGLRTTALRHIAAC